MSEIDDKKLVAEWMGYNVVHQGPYSNKTWVFYTGHDEYTTFRTWNPQDDDKATFKEWDEIYNNMREEETRFYLNSIMIPTVYKFKIHTAKPSIRWKALLQMIGEK